MSECQHYRCAVSGGSYTVPGCGLYGPGARACNDREHPEHCPLYARNADRRAEAAESAFLTERAKRESLEAEVERLKEQLRLEGHAAAGEHARAEHLETELMATRDAIVLAGRSIQTAYWPAMRPGEITMCALGESLHKGVRQAIRAFIALPSGKKQDKATVARILLCQGQEFALWASGDDAELLGEVRRLSGGVGSGLGPGGQQALLGDTDAEGEKTAGI